MRWRWFFHFPLKKSVSPTFPRSDIGLIGKFNQYGVWKNHKSATLQNFATFARRSSTAVHNSPLWPLDDAALLNFATMRIYANIRTEWKGFVVCCHHVVHFLVVAFFTLQVLIFSWWIGTSEQTSDIIRHNSIRCNSCVKSKNIGESFMMLLLEWTFLLSGFVQWLYLKNQHWFSQTNWCSN